MRIPFTVAIRMFPFPALLLPTTGNQNHTATLADKMCHSVFFAVVDFAIVVAIIAVDYLRLPRTTHITIALTRL